MICSCGKELSFSTIDYIDDGFEKRLYCSNCKKLLPENFIDIIMSNIKNLPEKYILTLQLHLTKIKDGKILRKTLTSDLFLGEMKNETDKEKATKILQNFLDIIDKQNISKEEFIKYVMEIIG